MIKKRLFAYILAIVGLTQLFAFNFSFSDQYEATQNNPDHQANINDEEAFNYESSGRGGASNSDNNIKKDQDSDVNNSGKSPYADVLRDTISDKSLESVLVGSEVTDKTGSELFNQQVVNLMDYAINIFIVIGIIFTFIGAYKIMFSNKEDEFKSGIRLVVFGLLGVIIMVSAKFIAGALNQNLIREFVDNENGPNGILFVQSLYENILYPFIKIALYFVVGALFFVMAAKVVSFVTSTDDANKKKAGGIILWCIVGIFVVIGSKQIVEAVMGKQEAVLNQGAQQINELGNQMLEFGSMPIIAQVINWIMGLTMLIILILIIIQGYKMFTKPDEPKNRESLKKTLLYIVIGVLVIGASYVLSNVLVINKIPIS